MILILISNRPRFVCLPPKKKQLQYVTAPDSFDELWLSFETSKNKIVRSQKMKETAISPFRATREKMVEFNIEYKLFASFFAINVYDLSPKNYYQIPILLPSPNQNLSKNPRKPNLQKKTTNLPPIEFQASAFFQYLPVHQRSVARMHFLSPGTMRRRSPWLLEKGISPSSENGTSVAKGLRKSAFFFDGEDDIFEKAKVWGPQKNLRNVLPFNDERSPNHRSPKSIYIYTYMLIIYERDLPYLDSSSWLWLTRH